MVNANADLGAAISRPEFASLPVHTFLQPPSSPLNTSLAQLDLLEGRHEIDTESLVHHEPEPECTIVREDSYEKDVESRHHEMESATFTVTAVSSEKSCEARDRALSSPLRDPPATSDWRAWALQARAEVGSRTIEFARVQSVSSSGAASKLGETLEDDEDDDIDSEVWEEAAEEPVPNLSPADQYVDESPWRLLRWMRRGGSAAAS